MRKKIFIETAGGGAMPRLARVTAILMLLLMAATQGAWAASGIAATASDIGKVLCTDGSIYATVADATTAGKTAAAMIAYIDTENSKGLAIQLNSSPVSKNWEDAKTYAEGLAAVPGGTWRLPSMGDWQNMFLGCAIDEDALFAAERMTPIKGFKEKIAATGTTWKSNKYWSSTSYDEQPWRVDVHLSGNQASAQFYEDDADEDYLVLGCLAFDVTAPAAPAGYSVALAPGTEDAANWTITPSEGLSEGDPVNIQYNGTRRIRSITAVVKEAEPAGNTVDLAALTADYEAQDGDVLTGTLAGNYKITIADRATVTLQGVNINGVNEEEYSWAGLTLAGDGTIVLSGTNNVKGFYDEYPGIYVPEGKTVTIKGDGSLNASSNGFGAGIGGGDKINCGNITIEGGTITATGGENAAGIGSSNMATCSNISITGGNVTATGGEGGAGIGSGYSNNTRGNISITGGTVTATGGEEAAGIGSGYWGSCGDITITDGVVSVTATKGDKAPNSIGKGKNGFCGTVTIGGTEGAISTSPYTYAPVPDEAPDEGAGGGLE